MKHSATPATQFLARHQVDYTEHFYDYVEHGGTTVSSSALGVDEHHVVKTLVMETDAGDPLIVLMHGDRKVSTRELARVAGVKRIFPCKPEVAQRHSGYLVGGTSPFGTRKPLPIYMERSINALPAIYINGGRRGLLVKIRTQDLVKALQPQLVEAALED